VLALRSTFAVAKRSSKLVFTLNKVSTVTLTVLRKGRPVLTRSARFGYGRHAFAIRPAGAAASRSACVQWTWLATSARWPEGSRSGRAE
jgi:hypothetical protein